MKTPTILSLVSFAALGLPGPFQAAEVIHYWDFDTLEGDLPADVVGGVATSANGAPDVSTHPVYGEAYEGSGQSLNTAMGSADYLVADVLDPAGGGENALEFGAGSFSYSTMVLLSKGNCYSFLSIKMEMCPWEDGIR